MLAFPDMVLGVIDLRALRDDPEPARASQRARGADPAVIDVLLSADTDRRAAVSAADQLRAEQKAFGRTMGSASAADRPGLLARGKELAEQVRAAGVTEREAEQVLEAAQRQVPNIIEQGVPAGGVDDFVVLREVGQVPEFDYPVRDHLELGELLGAIDTERGAKVSGARFYYLRGVGARLQWALTNLAVSKAVERGFEPLIPPVLVKPEAMEGTGFLGDHAVEVYRLEADDLYLVGTAEVPLAAYHSGEILDLSAGPLRYLGVSSCFRREAGSYGKDTRGIIRVHQFDKAEMFVYCQPDQASQMHLELLAFEEEMLSSLGLAYRVIDTAAGDLGASAARKYDCEAWIPSQRAYRELTSTSNCTTFQSRRLGTRYRDVDGRTQIAATLNGTLATTRWLVAILENNQQADGSVLVPPVLQPYLGLEVLTPIR